MDTYSVKEIADMLNTNPETVRRWIRSGKLEAIQESRKGGNVVTKSMLDAFLKASPKSEIRKILLVNIQSSKENIIRKKKSIKHLQEEIEEEQQRIDEAEKLIKELDEKVRGQEEE